MIVEMIRNLNIDKVSVVTITNVFVNCCLINYCLCLIICCSHATLVGTVTVAAGESVGPCCSL